MQTEDSNLTYLRKKGNIVEIQNTAWIWDDVFVEWDWFKMIGCYIIFNKWFLVNETLFISQYNLESTRDCRRRKFRPCPHGDMQIEGWWQWTFYLFNCQLNPKYHKQLLGRGIWFKPPACSWYQIVHPEGSITLALRQLVLSKSLGTFTLIAR